MKNFWGKHSRQPSCHSQQPPVIPDSPPVIPDVFNRESSNQVPAAKVPPEGPVHPVFGSQNSAVGRSIPDSPCHSRQPPCHSRHF